MIRKTFLFFTQMLLLSNFTFAQDNAAKFKIYGFADMSFQKIFFKDNAFIKSTTSYSDRFEFTFDHLNLYTDFTPNDRVRMLVELGYKHTPDYLLSEMGKIVTIEGMLNDTLTSATSTSSEKKNGLESFEIERAIFQLKINQYAKLTFGKFITPAGIWNVDHGSPVILTLRQPTQFSIIELFPKSQIGIMEEGVFFLGDADLTYCLYAGTGRNEVQIEELKDISVGGQLKYNVPLLDEFRVGASAYTGISRPELQYMHIKIDKETVDQITSQAVSEVQSGLIGIGNLQSRIQQLISDELQKPDNFSFTSTDISKSRENVLGIDLRLYKHRIGLQSELNFQMTRSLLGGHTGRNNLGVYGLAFVDAVKRMNFVLTPYFCHERITFRDENNKTLETSPISGYNITMLGVNAKLFSNFGIKLEFSHLDLVTAGIFTDYQDNSDAPIISGQFNVSF